MNVCDLCNYRTMDRSNYVKHCKTKRHLSFVESMPKDSHNAEYTCPSTGHIFKYKCSHCDYRTNFESHYDRHIKSIKHAAKKTTNECDLADNVSLSSLPQEEAVIPPKKVKSTGGLNDIVVELLKQNQEFKMLLQEQADEMKRGYEVMVQNQQLITQSQHTITKTQKELVDIVDSKIVNNNVYQVTNNNNNNINFNFFLQVKCKDALNLSDFIDTLKLDTMTLEDVGKLGYVDGMSKIFVDELKQLELYKRPIHCTDVKRETIHIKEKNEWFKDTEDKSEIRNMISLVARRNINLIKDWQAENRECEILDSDKYFLWMDIIRQTMNQTELDDKKVLHNIAKEVYVNKKQMLTDEQDESKTSDTISEASIDAPT